MSIEKKHRAWSMEHGDKARKAEKGRSGGRVVD